MDASLFSHFQQDCSTCSLSVNYATSNGVAALLFMLLVDYSLSCLVISVSVDVTKKLNRDWKMYTSVYHEC